MLSTTFNFDWGNLLTTLIGAFIAFLLGLVAFYIQQGKIKKKLYRENLTYFKELIENAVITWESQADLIYKFANRIVEKPLDYNIPDLASNDDWSLLKEFRSLELYHSFSWFSEKSKQNIKNFSETYSVIDYITKRYYQDVDYILNHGKIYLNFRDKISENIENLYYTIYNTLHQLDKYLNEQESQYCNYLIKLSNKIVLENKDNMDLEKTLDSTITPAIGILVNKFENEENCLNIIILLKRIQTDSNKIVSQCKATVNTLSFFEKETSSQIQNLRILSKELTDFLSNKKL
jgi:gas vesicle protein